MRRKGRTINVRLAYYGDDFTGSTDVMESLTYGGLRTVLFVKPPSRNALARFQGAEAIGVAGASRAMSPAEMEATLPSVFAELLALKPAVLHYKTCSTFDSSPTTGSVGKAIELGLAASRTSVCPLIVGAPALARYCVFGNLFARSGLDSVPYRLDRHPTMRTHPVTPMEEADLREHLKLQTSLPTTLVDVLALDAGNAPWGVLDSAPRIVLFDTLREAHLEVVGRALEEIRAALGKPLFVAGSSGVGYALVKTWQSQGMCQPPSSLGGGIALPQTLVVSGSCSPVTARQIAWARERGFATLALDTHQLTEGGGAIDTLLPKVLAALAEDKSVIVHSCLGPDDARLQSTRIAAQPLGAALGTLLDQALQAHPLARVCVTGGDTSGHVARHLGIDALEMVGPLAPGSPLCVARSARPHIEGLEITFKGGQVGHDHFFEAVLAGKPIA